MSHFSFVVPSGSLRLCLTRRQADAHAQCEGGVYGREILLGAVFGLANAGASPSGPSPVLHDLLVR